MQWSYCSLVYVVGSAMGNVMYDFDNIQSSTWGWGVFYAWDSNAADGRCEFVKDKGGYDCPGGWDTGKPGGFTPGGGFTGAGQYPAGNPFANSSWGGGASTGFGSAVAPFSHLPHRAALCATLRRAQLPPRCSSSCCRCSDAPAP